MPPGRRSLPLPGADFIDLGVGAPVSESGFAFFFVALPWSLAGGFAAGAGAPGLLAPMLGEGMGGGSGLGAASGDIGRIAPGCAGLFSTPPGTRSFACAS